MLMVPVELVDQVREDVHAPLVLGKVFVQWRTTHTVVRSQWGRQC